MHFFVRRLKRDNAKSMAKKYPQDTEFNIAKDTLEEEEEEEEEEWICSLFVLLYYSNPFSILSSGGL